MGSDMQCMANDSFNLSTSEARLLMYTDLQKITASIVMPCIWLVGLLGNSAFLFVVARVRSMRTVTNFYLANLAVADMVFLSIVVIRRAYSLAVYGIPNDTLGPADCVGRTLFTYTFHFAGLILITFMSMERYIAVCHPLKHRLISGRSSTVKLVIACWLSSMALSTLLIPQTMIHTQFCVEWPTEDADSYKDFPEVIGQCRALNEPWVFQMFHLTQTIPFFVAFFGNAYFYARIVLKLHNRDSFSDRQRIVRTRNHVALMLVANGTVFFLTLTSFEVTSMILFIESFLPDGVILIPYDLRDGMFEANRVLLYANSAVNPFVYTLTNARYRRAFKRAFTPASCRKGRPRSSSIFSTFPDYYSQYRFRTGCQTSLTRPRSPARSPLVARPATYSNACFDQNELATGNDAETASGFSFGEINKQLGRRASIPTENGEQSNEQVGKQANKQ